MTSSKKPITMVVLLAEDVDRNLEDQRVYKAKLVVLLAEDVDRNCHL